MGRASFQIFPSLGSPFQVPHAPLSFLLSLGCCSSAGFGLHWRVLDITVLEGFKGAEMKASAFEDG